MRTTLIALIVLVTFASAQQLMIAESGDYSAQKNMKDFAMDIGQDWLDKHVGITWESVTAHAPLLVAGVLYYFMENVNLAFISGEKLIPTIMSMVFGKDWVEMNTSSDFRLKF